MNKTEEKGNGRERDIPVSKRVKITREIRAGKGYRTREG